MCGNFIFEAPQFSGQCLSRLACDGPQRDQTDGLSHFMGKPSQSNNLKGCHGHFSALGMLVPCQWGVGWPWVEAVVRLFLIISRGVWNQFHFTLSQCMHLWTALKDL
jgi:hypothetical protein